MSENNIMLRVIEDFCNRNLGNRLSADLCGALLNLVQSELMKQDRAALHQAVAGDLIQSKSQEKVNALS